jgi:hypothetical protein
MDARRHTPQTLLVAAAASVFLSACGGLDTPDLTVGDVTGQLDGAVAPASDVADWNVHVVGKPEVFAKVDSNGRFTLTDVPAGPVKLVVFDGKQNGRAEVVVVEVKGAERNAFRRDSKDMPKAGRIRAAARCLDGRDNDGTEIEVEDGATSQRTRIRRAKATSSEDEIVELYPVPKGTWKLTAKYQGGGQEYGPTQEPVVAIEGSDDEPPHDYELELEPEDD